MPVEFSELKASWRELLIERWVVHLVQAQRSVSCRWLELLQNSVVNKRMRLTKPVPELFKFSFIAPYQSSYPTLSSNCFPISSFDSCEEEKAESALKFIPIVYVQFFFSKISKCVLKNSKLEFYFKVKSNTLSKSSILALADTFEI